MEKYFVLVINIDTGMINKAIECRSYKEATIVDRGLNINLNHKKYYTKIKEPNNVQ